MGERQAVTFVGMNAEDRERLAELVRQARQIA
jgi:hypothetical protein